MYKTVREYFSKERNFRSLSFLKSKIVCEPILCATFSNFPYNSRITSNITGYGCLKVYSIEFNGYVYEILNSLKLSFYPPHLPRRDDKFVVQFHYVVYD